MKICNKKSNSNREFYSDLTKFPNVGENMAENISPQTKKKSKNNVSRLDLDFILYLYIV
jgi:hypothetical protein